MSRRAMMVAPAGGGGGGSGFRYFRIRTTRTFNGNNTGIATIETREVSGGTDYASGATATASATAGTGFEPDKAIDGNASTFWSTGGATDTDGSNWLALDFGTPRDITEVKITVRPDGFREDPKAFTFQVSSDGTTWTVPTNWFFISQSTWSAGETRTFTKPTGDTNPRGFRIRTTATWASGFLGIAEFQARETSGGTDYAAASNGGIAEGGIELAGYPATNVNDGNVSTFTTSGGSTLAGGENWVAVQFTAGRNITEAKITVRNDGFREDPKDFVFESTTDSITWDSMSWSYTAEAAWSNGETRTFTKP